MEITLGNEQTVLCHSHMRLVETNNGGVICLIVVQVGLLLYGHALNAINLVKMSA